MYAEGLDSETGSRGAERASNPSIGSRELSGKTLKLMVEAIGQGGAALRGNPLRAGLGALAIGVAVATIVLVVSALEGVALYARQSTARTFGSDTFLIAQVASPGRVSRRELQEQLQRNPPIRRSELKFLEQYAGGLVIYAPNAQTRADVISGAYKIENVSITGTTWQLADIRDLAIARGRFFRADEDQRGEQVTVIGADVVDALFPAVDPLGQSVRIAGRKFTVIGVQQRQGQSGGASLDKYAWLPLRAYERAFGAPKTLQIFAKATGDQPSVVGRGPRAHLVPRPPDAGARRRRHVRHPDARRGAGLRRQPVRPHRRRRRTDLADGAARGHRRGDQYGAGVGDPAHAGDRRAPRTRRAPPADHARGSGGVGAGLDCRRRRRDRGGRHAGGAARPRARHPPHGSSFHRGGQPGGVGAERAGGGLVSRAACRRIST